MPLAYASASVRSRSGNSPWPPAPRSGATASPARPFLRLWPAAPFANASFFRLRAEGALLVSAVRLGGATTWAAVEADLLADGSGAGAAVAFSIFCPDWTAVDSLSVVAAPGVAAVRWRVDVIISSGALGKVMRPAVLMELTLTDGAREVFDVPLESFHALRFGCAKLLSEMQAVEGSPILRIA